MFSFNFLNMLILQLPVKLRQVTNIAWIEVLTKLVGNLSDDFKTYRINKLFFLQHNSQVIYLEHILNSRFNEGGTEIYIEDAPSPDIISLYNKSEATDPFYLYNKDEGVSPPDVETIYFYNRAEYPASGGLFVINIPIALQGIVDENELKALVNRLKLAGKQYSIYYYGTPM